MNLRLDESKSWNTAAVAALLVPALAVLAVKTLSPALGPATARGFQSEPEVQTQSILNRPITDEQRRLAATMQGIDSREFGTTPLRAPAVAVDPASHLPVQPSNNTPTLADPTTLFALTSVAGSPERPLAVINGKVRPLGAPLGDGWTLAQVDFPKGAAELEHQTGTKAWIYIARIKGLEESQTQPPPDRVEPR